MRSFTTSLFVKHSYNENDQIKEDEMGRAYCTQGRSGKLTKFCWGTEGTKPLGRPRLRREDNIEMDVRAIGWGGMDWIHLAQYRDQWKAPVNMVMNLRVA
jgi:hypothetical protein